MTFMSKEIDQHINLVLLKNEKDDIKRYDIIKP